MSDGTSNLGCTERFAGSPTLDVFRTETDAFGNAGLTTFRAGMNVRHMKYWGKWGLILSSGSRLHDVSRDNMLCMTQSLPTWTVRRDVISRIAGSCLTYAADQARLYANVFREQKFRPGTPRTSRYRSERFVEMGM